MYDHLVQEVASWPHVAVLHSEVGNAVIFRLGPAEIGHLHPDGTLDIPLPQSIQEQVLIEKLAIGHPDLPDSGWIRYNIETSRHDDVAMRLLRLSFLTKVASRKRTHVGRAQFADLDLATEVELLKLPDSIESVFRERWPTVD